MAAYSKIIILKKPVDMVGLRSALKTYFGWDFDDTYRLESRTANFETTVTLNFPTNPTAAQMAKVMELISQFTVV